jgi:hypothetical protein
MCKRLFLILASVAALAVVASGCGSDDAADTTGTAEVEVTKTQSIKQADAACSKQNEALSKHFGEFSLENPIKNGQPTKAQGLEFSEEYFIPYVEDRIRLLQNVDVPAGDQKELEAIVVATEDGLERMEKNVEANRTSSQDPLGRAEAMSRKFGFTVCGET